MQRGGVAWLARLTRLWARVGLGVKMATIVVIGTIALVGGFLYLGTAALNESIQRTLQERVLLAQTHARYLDYVLLGIEQTLPDVAHTLALSNPHASEATLADAHQRMESYARQIFFLDRDGRVRTFPPTISVPPLSTLPNEPSSTIHYATYSVTESEPLVLASAPVRDANGASVGTLFVRLDLSGPNMRLFADPIGLGESGYMDLVDHKGLIIASTRAARIGLQSDHRATFATLIQTRQSTVSMCHDCHTGSSASARQREVLVFAPLERAPWGIAIRQSEDKVLAAVHHLQQRIFLLMGIILVGALGLVYVITRSIIAPIQALTAATQRIAIGDLDTPLDVRGEDEIGVLARSFDAMRARVKQSLAEIQMWNRELEARVQERTRACEQAQSELHELNEELRRKEQARRALLRRVFSAQEEERKRISRELHDETCQVLTGLAYALDEAIETFPSPEFKPQLEHMRTLVTTALREIQHIILDLRPTMLDHLGLVPALRWYAESRLEGTGIRFTLREQGEPARLPSAVETALFRVTQEALNNIARHSRATRAECALYFAPTQVRIVIKDNGKGFDPKTIFSSNEHRRGLGLLGMQERMSAVGGRVEIDSTPGEGTVIRLLVPLQTN
ncbi:MAG: HAMP domain-containing protein [Anaerolineae bacterium]|nr:HAMP domain-containing protein [Anaerolineae bacterium]